MKHTNKKNNISEILKVYIINSITKSYILNIKIRPLVTKYALTIKQKHLMSSVHYDIVIYLIKKTITKSEEE
jgi:hypothetical protein